MKQDFTEFFILISVFIVCWKYGISNRINKINLLFGYQKLLNKKLIILSIIYIIIFLHIRLLAGRNLFLVMMSFRIL